MKIVYVTEIFPTLSTTFILNQVTGLIKRGHEIEIISLYRPKEDIVHESVTKYNLQEKTIYLCDVLSCFGYKYREKFISTLILTDLIHAHFANRATDLALQLSKIFSIPFVCTAHAADIFVNPDVKKLREKFDSAIKVITISNYNREYLLDLLGKDLTEKIVVIRCGINLNKFTYIERGPKRVLKILYVGRLVEKKGITYGIRAFKQLLKECHNVEFRIIGEGPLFDDAVNLIHSSNLQDKIVMLGPQPQSRILREMKEADIFFLPSLTAENGNREGAPVAIMEANAMGLPTISTLHTGIPELVAEGKSGFLVQEKDINAMTERLKTLVNNFQLRNNMGKEGRKRIEEKYNHKVEIDRLEGLFNDQMKEKVLKSSMPKEQQKTTKQTIKNYTTQLKQLQSFMEQIKNSLTYLTHNIFNKPIRNIKKLFKKM